MSGMQQISGTGSMSQSCSMKSMNGSSSAKAQDAIQAETEKQSMTRQEKIPNQLLGSKIDVKA